MLVYLLLKSVSMSGRIGKIAKEKILSDILEKKAVIVTDKNKIVAKTNNVWVQLSEGFSGLLQAHSLHAMVCGNRYGLRDALLGEVSIEMQEESTASEDPLISDSNDEHIFQEKKRSAFFSPNNERRFYATDKPNPETKTEYSRKATTKLSAAALCALLKGKFFC